MARTRVTITRNDPTARQHSYVTGGDPEETAETIAAEMESMGDRYVATVEEGGGIRIIPRHSIASIFVAPAVEDDLPDATQGHAH